MVGNMKSKLNALAFDSRQGQEGQSLYDRLGQQPTHCAHGPNTSTRHWIRRLRYSLCGSFLFDAARITYVEVPEYAKEL